MPFSLYLSRGGGGEGGKKKRAVDFSDAFFIVFVLIFEILSRAYLVASGSATLVGTDLQIRILCSAQLSWLNAAGTWPPEAVTAA